MSLSFRILLVVILAFGASVGVLVYSELHLRAQREAELREEALRLAYVAAADQERTIEGARQLLVAVAQLPPVRNRDIAACTRLLSGLKQQLHIYEYLSVTTLDRRVVCSSNFDAAVSKPRFNRDPPPALKPNGEIYVGRFAELSTGAQLLRLYYPVLLPDGSIGGVMQAGLSLKWLNAALATRHQPDGTTVLIADRNGTIVGQYPHPDFIGRMLPASLRAVVDAPDAGIDDAIDLDGRRRILGYLPPSVPPGQGLFISVGIDSVTAMAAIAAAMWRDIALFGIVLAIAAVAAWIYVERSIRAPLAGLLETARRWSLGDRAARAQPTSTIPEVSRVAMALNSAADAIEASERDLGAARADAERLGASFRHLFQNNPVPMFVFELGSRRCLEVNDSAIAQYGYSREELLKRTLYDLMPERELPDFRQNLRWYMGDHPLELQRLGIKRHRRADGSIIYVEVVRHALDYRGRKAVLTGAIDVTDRKLAEERLRRSEEHLARAQRISGTGSIVRDLRTHEFEVSDEAYRIFGIDKTRGALTTEAFLKLVHPDDWGVIMVARVDAERAVAPAPYEFRITRPDGTERLILRVSHTELDDAGNPAFLIGMIRDITEVRAAERKQAELERHLNHSQRLEALGTLAGGVAHDLNNTLLPILALTKLAVRHFPESSRERANMDVVIQAAERARDLVRQILTFSRKQEMEQQETDLAAIVREAVRMMRSSLPAAIAIVEELGEAPPVLGDAGQLHQVVINLVANAAQAIGTAPGRIVVGVAAAFDAIEGRSPGPAIRLSVTDDGCGMDEATQNRIFEPFFTTKPVGEGTGLGLSVVHGIVVRHGGRIAVSTAPGEGATITVILPALNSWTAEMAGKVA